MSKRISPDQIFLSEARAGGLVILDDSVAAADATLTVAERKSRRNP
ncbi:hypothetical protein [Mycobacterium xenopi]|uniref:Uncharacterized protein n=1 Tax=Mycobacterium xenopi TaxID=1789 RepID=A0AAD1M176_MYCXE|nr:hypothetical protein [Mycobacterium xenopi]BBU22146.1 hypothetical protein MYXE_19360 [Mycobacterium xenopi]SPX77990.1 Uncharacterised protein [Mycobacterium xenopi]